MKKKTGTKKKTVVEFNRHQIGSISLTDIDYIDSLSVSDRRNYLQQAENIWTNPVFQNEIKTIIQKQLEFIGMESKDYNQILIGRGTINGVSLLQERLETLHSEYIQGIKPPEKFDEFDVGV
jgi:hypothetical protein